VLAQPLPPQNPDSEQARKKAEADRLRAAEKFMVIGSGNATCKASATSQPLAALSRLHGALTWVLDLAMAGHAWSPGFPLGPAVISVAAAGRSHLPVLLSLHSVNSLILAC
jgi:hypothetical protein